MQSINLTYSFVFVILLFPPTFYPLPSPFAPFTPLRFHFYAAADSLQHSARRTLPPQSSDRFDRITVSTELAVGSIDRRTERKTIEKLPYSIERTDGSTHLHALPLHRSPAALPHPFPHPLAGPAIDRQFDRFYLF